MTLLMLSLPHTSAMQIAKTLGVVPIFVNAGAALLPAIIAGLTSLVALLLSPRAMLNLCRRKPWLPVVIVAAVACVWFFPRLLPAATPKPVTTVHEIDWPALARDIQRQQASPQSLLKLLWQNDLGTTSAYSTPAVYHGTIYLPTTLRDVTGASGCLFAIDAKTGKERWVATKSSADDFLKPFFSSPAITDQGNYLIVGEGLHEDKDSPLLCFALKGATENNPPPVAWAAPTPLHVESSPAIFTRKGKQYAVVGAGAIEGNDRLPIGNAGFVFCVAIDTGKEVWREPVNDPESSPAVDEEGTVYIGAGFNGNAVVALRSDADLAGKPRQLWKTPTTFPAVGDVTLATSPVAGKIVLIGAGNGDYVYSDPHPAGIVLALDRKTGKSVWQTPLPDSVLGPLHVTADAVLAACRDGDAYALRLSDGKILWHTQISATPKTPVLAGIATDGPHCFALAADGTLAILSTANGNLFERLKLADNSKPSQNVTLSTPVYDKTTGVLYVATETMGLRAYKVGIAQP